MNILKRIIHRILMKVFEWKYHFDIGFSLLTVINLGLLVLANSEKLQKVFAIKTIWLVGFAVPSILYGVFLIGWLMDKFKYRARQNELASLANPVLMELLERVKRIEEKQNEKIIR